MPTITETEQHYQQLLRDQPRQPAAWCRLGEARLRLGKCSEAAAAYQNALRLEPATADAHFRLATVRKQQGQRGDAIACYRRGLELAPDQVEALLNLGVLLAAGAAVASGTCPGLSQCRRGAGAGRAAR